MDLVEECRTIKDLVVKCPIRSMVMKTMVAAEEAIGVEAVVEEDAAAVEAPDVVAVAGFATTAVDAAAAVVSTTTATITTMGTITNLVVDNLLRRPTTPEVLLHRQL
jgi:hypothetical protein